MVAAKCIATAACTWWGKAEGPLLPMGGTTIRALLHHGEMPVNLPGSWPSGAWKGNSCIEIQLQRRKALLLAISHTAPTCWCICMLNRGMPICCSNNLPHLLTISAAQCMSKCRCLLFECTTWPVCCWSSAQQSKTRARALFPRLIYTAAQRRSGHELATSRLFIDPRRLKLHCVV